MQQQINLRNLTKLEEAIAVKRLESLGPGVQMGNSDIFLPHQVDTRHLTETGNLKGPMKDGLLAAYILARTCASAFHMPQCTSSS